jgi:hypothetical protein
MFTFTVYNYPEIPDSLHGMNELFPFWKQLGDIYVLLQPQQGLKIVSGTP